MTIPDPCLLRHPIGACYFLDMYAFLLAAAPLTLLALSAWFYSAEERQAGPIYIFKGLISSFPAVLLWLAFSLQIRPNWGSGSIIPLFWLQYWLLPQSLLVVTWLISNGFGSIANLKARTFLSFALPYTTTLLAASLVISWRLPFAPPSLALPLLTISGVLLLATCLELAAWHGLPSGLVWLLIYLAGSFLAAWAYALFFMRHELSASILTFVVSAAGIIFSLFVLHKRLR